MYNTFEEIKELGEQLTGLEVKRLPSEFGGSLRREENGELHIRIGTKKPPIGEIPYSECSHRTFSAKYLLLQVLLHEVAHYRQFLRFGNVEQFLVAYNKNQYRFEIIADRYALMYYRRFVK